MKFSLCKVVGITTSGSLLLWGSSAWTPSLVVPTSTTGRTARVLLTTQGRTAPTTTVFSSDELSDVDVTKSDWYEESVRNTAAEVLHSVFENNNLPTKVEKALKVALRGISDGHVRKQVSQLVLGTSIMRKRHEYVYDATAADAGAMDLDMFGRLRYMVDLHVDYLTNGNSTALNKVTWPSDPVDRIAVQYSMPNFLIEQWLDEYGVEETESLCRISNKPGPITLRRNAIQCSSDEELVSRLLKEEGVELSSPMIPLPGCLRITSGRPRSIWAMAAWKDGWFEVQDVGSQLITSATEIDALTDKVVVDYCAGNGGKSLALASQLHQQQQGNNRAPPGHAMVWAHDVAELRLAQLRGSLSRSGVFNTSIRMLTTSSAHEDLHDEMANVVLVDAPCSSCGVLRRRPGHRWELTEEEIAMELPRLQLEILTNASRLVKPGGRLVYATCSVCHCENEKVAAAWEQSQSLSTSSSLWEPWPFPLTASSTWSMVPQQHGTPEHFCKLMPHEHDSDGFFIARWRRRKGQ